VIVFRDSIIERRRLSTTQEEANSERERRSESIARDIVRFEQSVDQALTKVRARRIAWRPPSPAQQCGRCGIAEAQTRRTASARRRKM